ncbi:MAG: hypothetical protein WCI18_14010, partial [Pseudomonadota bacterium]
IDCFNYNSESCPLNQVTSRSKLFPTQLIPLAILRPPFIINDFIRWLERLVRGLASPKCGNAAQTS